MNNRVQGTITSLALAVVLGTTTLASVATGQENIAAMRFTWDFNAGGGAIYMNICNKPRVNIDEQSGGCADVNVLDEVITGNRSKTKLITDRLRVGTLYKACLVADNISNGKKGRWITCQVFTAKDELTIPFSYSDLQFVRKDP